MTSVRVDDAREVEAVPTPRAGRIVRHDDGSMVYVRGGGMRSGSRRS
jgi:hypothetical protein